MGEIEQKGKKRKAKRNLKKALLKTLQAAAVLGVAVAAPNLPAALYKMGLLPKRGDSSTITLMRSRMLKKGLLAVNPSGLLRLTPRGRRELELLQTRETLLHTKRRWDGRWRVLIFDIPEYRKSVRNKMRRTLMSVGFMRLQDSVWIYPHDCEDFIVLLKADFKIGRDVLYMIVDELEGDARIKRYFGLH